MVLQMARPWKDTKTGMYYVRKRVPSELRPIVGKGIRKISLGTKDPTEAKARFPEAHQRLLNEWQALRSPPAAIPHMQLVALAGEQYREFMGLVEDEPGEPRIWENTLAMIERIEATPEGIRQWHLSNAERILRERGLNADETSFDRLIQELHQAYRMWAEQQLRRSQGDYGPDPNADRFPPLSAASARPREATGMVSVTALFQLWEREHALNGGSPRTVHDYRSKVEKFIDFLGHDDAQRVTPLSVDAWCDHLLDREGLSKRTVATKYLSAVKGIFKHGKRKLRITEDPASIISMKYPKPDKVRPKGFTDDEAKAILTASLCDPETLGRMAEHNKQAVRWVPWICAYTGARVGEITQLRREDLILEYGISCIRITPEAGTVKAGGYRTVPVHPHLIEQGLIEFIVSRPQGPLFFVSGDDADPVKRAGNAGKKVCKWVRESAGVTDPRVQPNHGWRHRFKTLARDVDMPHEYMNAIQGHAGGKAADDYGENTMKALYREIQKLPRFAV